MITINVDKVINTKIQTTIKVIEHGYFPVWLCHWINCDKCHYPIQYKDDHNAIKIIAMCDDEETRHYHSECWRKILDESSKNQSSSL